MSSETWRVIHDFPNYAVSSLGRVKQLAASEHVKSETILKPVIRAGYLAVRMYKAPKSRREIRDIHRLLAFAFLGLPPTSLSQVNHLNANKLDNRPENLEWVSPSQNCKHAYQLGLIKVPQNPMKTEDRKGVLNPNAKLTEEDVKTILQLAPQRGMPSILAKRFNVCLDLIYAIRAGERWPHIRANVQ